jgi:hypothetical protein
MKSLRRKFDEGVADVQLTRKHPHLATELPLGWLNWSRRERVLRALAERYPRMGDALMAASLRLLPMWEALTLRFRWRKLLEGALTYWYWRGVATALQGQALHLPAGDTADSQLPAIDLANGIEHTEGQLDHVRPAGVVLTLAGEVIATVPARAGYERVRGVHLRRLLAFEYQSAYAQALRRARLLPRILASALERSDERAPGGTARDSASRESAASPA